MSDDFDDNVAAFAEKVREHIAAYGRTVLGIGATPPFCYTIGNHLRGFPELLLIGGAGRPFQDVLNAASDVAEKRGKPLEDRERVDIGAKFPLLILEAYEPARRDYMVQAENFLGTRLYRAQQVVCCDPRGVFPGEPGCAEPYASIPLIGRSH